jgi:hypothetical protein
MGPLAGLAAGIGLAALASHFGFGEELASMMMMGLIAVAVIAADRLLYASPMATQLNGRRWPLAQVACSTPVRQLRKYAAPQPNQVLRQQCAPMAAPLRHAAGRKHPGRLRR